MNTPYRTADDGALIEALRQKLEPSEVECFPPASLDAIRDAESRIGFAFPPLLVRIWTELQNGAFGPGNGILGVPPDGYVDDDLGEDIVTHYRDGVAEGFCPERTIALCNWGCAIWSHVDCSSALAPILTDEVVHDSDGRMSIRYHLTAPSLHVWLQKWVSGISLFDDMHEVVGERTVMNPFTRRPMTRFDKRLKGPIVYTSPLR